MILSVQEAPDFKRYFYFLSVCLFVPKGFVACLLLFASLLHFSAESFSSHDEVGSLRFVFFVGGVVGWGGSGIQLMIFQWKRSRDTRPLLTHCRHRP